MLFQTREEGKALLNQITRISGIPDTLGEDDTMGGTGDLGQAGDDDSLVQEMLDKTAASPAPHLSPRNLHFHTPDH